MSALAKNRIKTHHVPILVGKSVLVIGKHPDSLHNWRVWVSDFQMEVVVYDWDLEDPPGSALRPVQKDDDA